MENRDIQEQKKNHKIGPIKDDQRRILTDDKKKAESFNPQGGLSIKSDGGSECWALRLTLKYKKILFLTTLEYNFCKAEAPEI